MEEQLVSLAEWCGKSSVSRVLRGSPGLLREGVLGRAAGKDELLQKLLPTHCPLHPLCEVGLCLLEPEEPGASCKVRVHLPPKLQNVKAPGPSLQVPKTDLRKAMCSNP